MNRIKNLDNLEYMYLKDLTELKSEIMKQKIQADNKSADESYYEGLKYISSLIGCGYSPSILKNVGKIDEETAIFMTIDYNDNELYEVTDKKLIDLSEQEDIFIIKGGYGEFGVVSKELLDTTYIEELQKTLNNLEIPTYRLRIGGDEDRYQIVTREIIENKIKEEKENMEIEAKEREERIKREEQEKDKTAEDKRGDFENKGTYYEHKTEEEDEFGNINVKYSGIAIEDKIITHKGGWRKYKFEFSSPVNSFLTFDEVKNLDDSEQNKLLSIFLEKKIDFDYEYDNKKICKITFEGSNKDRIKIDGISVMKAKVLFILGKIRSNTLEKSKIELYNKLSGMKVELLELRGIDFNMQGINRGNKDDEDNLNIPIQISYLDDNFFRVTLFDKSIPMNWERITHYFFERSYRDNYGREKAIVSRSVHKSFNLKLFTELTQELGMDKAYIFENLNKIKLFNAI